MEKSKKLTAEQLEDAKRLRALYESKKKSLKVTQQKIADELDVSQGAIGHYLTGRNALNIQAASAFARFLEVSISEFSPSLAREAASLSQVANSPATHKPEDSLPPPSEWTPVSPWDRNTPLNDDEIEIPFFKSIELAAGFGCFGTEDNNGFKLRFSKSTIRRAGASAENVVAVTVHGDSMSPVIPDGATVTIDMGNKTIKDGAIYAIEQDELFRLKLLYRLPGRRLSIRSYNKDDYPDEEADMDTVKIIGRVIHWSVMAI
ncbi:helix-turn-helix transcriptional regulator [Salmonella enterica]|nr:helix-turn-helix transcriptional regulator [Salmonella enterica]HEC8456402.1 helix-turn-helix transcriptional regulator [Salmonella enterica subsp. enterica serovar Poona]